VQKVYDICKANSYLLPTVYQGNYNPVARLTEAELFPLLRKLKISFNAYSPLAGGFLVKDASLFTSQGSGRWDKDNMIGQIYRTLYGKPALLEALKDWEAIARDAGVSKASLAYRWVLYHSALKGEFGDGCIIGATQTEQLEETLQDVKEGPLLKETVERIEGIWEKVEHEAPLDNYNSYMKKQISG
jgi:aflatoxin B1 aldehyde reductase